MYWVCGLAGSTEPQRDEVTLGGVQAAQRSRGAARVQPKQRLLALEESHRWVSNGGHRHFSRGRGEKNGRGALAAECLARDECRSAETAQQFRVEGERQCARRQSSCAINGPAQGHPHSNTHTRGEATAEPRQVHCRTARVREANAKLTHLGRGGGLERGRPCSASL